MKLNFLRRLQNPWAVFANLKMGKKLMVVFIFLISIPIIAISIISYENYSRSILVNTISYSKQASRTMLDKIDAYVSDINRISVLPLYSEDFQLIMSSPHITFDERKQVEAYLLSMNNMKKETSAIYVFDNFGRPFYTLKSEGLRSNYLRDWRKWKAMADDADGFPVVIGTQETYSTSGNVNYVFSLVRQVKSSSTLKPIGTILVDTNIRFFEDAVQQLDATTGGQTIIVDEHNRVIYDSDLQWITQDLSASSFVNAATGSSGDFRLAMHGEPYICTYMTSSNTGWKVLLYTPMDELTSGAKTTRNVTIVVTLLIVGFALFISVITSSALTRPLRNLTYLMKEVQKGNLAVRFNVKYQDEVALLASHFYKMVARIEELIGEVYASEQHKRIAEMRALQNQINPHFLYNTLETIRMMAEMNDDDRIAEMTFILGQLLRYGIQVNEEVTIREEMEHVKNYLFLQNVRFSNKFKLIIDVDEEFMKLKTVKLLFQPIVENAIYHGLETKEGQSTITIRALQLETHISFEVTDNGIGMDELTVRRLNAKLFQGVGKQDASRHSIGLINVDERIKLYYGPMYGLIVHSVIDQGTKVTLTLPNS